MDGLYTSTRRNPISSSNRKDALIDWMKEILNHSFVLDAPGTYIDSFMYFEELIDEHRANPLTSRLKHFVPSVGIFHTRLCLVKAWQQYDAKYSMSKRRHVCPSFNEFRHILNLAQVIAIGENLSLISFDGDQTLYQDGGNFDEDPDNELANSIISLLKANVKVAIITAAGYGNDGSKYAFRLQGLLTSFITHNLSDQEISQFYVFGGECNYLLQGHIDTSTTTPTIRLEPVDDKLWENMRIDPILNPRRWPKDEIKHVLDVAEETFKNTANEMNLRVKILRKERAVGIYPGGDEMVRLVPRGHGSNKIKSEALDESVLRVMESLRHIQPPTALPFCVFNGGRDAWLDIGNKGVGVAVLQSILNLPPEQCLHVGDQFLRTGNDRAARENCPCIWITSPRETEKILSHVLRYKLGGKGDISPRGLAGDGAGIDSVPEEVKDAVEVDEDAAGGAKIRPMLKRRISINHNAYSHTPDLVLSNHPHETGDGLNYDPSSSEPPSKVTRLSVRGDKASKDAFNIYTG